jgi:hypothetical protein
MTGVYLIASIGLGVAILSLLVGDIIISMIDKGLGPKGMVKEAWTNRKR